MQETRGFLQKVYRGSLGMMVNAMVEDQALSEEEIQELYGILEQAGKSRAKRSEARDERADKKSLHARRPCGQPHLFFPCGRA